MTGALTRYRVMAWIVGVYFTTLAVVGLPLEHLAHVGESVWPTLWMLHGFLYPVYLLTVVDVARRVPWKVVETALVGLAGTIPFLSFVAEHVMTRRTKEALAARPDATA